MSGRTASRTWRGGLCSRRRTNDPDVSLDPYVGSERRRELAHEIQNSPAKLRRRDPWKATLPGLRVSPHVDRIDANFLDAASFICHHGKDRHIPAAEQARLVDDAG